MRTLSVENMQTSFRDILKDLPYYLSQIPKSKPRGDISFLEMTCFQNARENECWPQYIKKRKLSYSMSIVWISIRVPVMDRKCLKLLRTELTCESTVQIQGIISKGFRVSRLERHLQTGVHYSTIHSKRNNSYPLT